MDDYLLRFFAGGDDKEIKEKFFTAAACGDVAMLKEAYDASIVVQYYSTNSEGRTALHLAAEVPGRKGVDTVRYLLENRIPWNVVDKKGQLPGDLALSKGNIESYNLLRESAIKSEFELFNRTSSPREDPFTEKRFNQIRADSNYDNRKFCTSRVAYLQMDESETAMLCVPDGTMIMAEWERPIVKKAAELLLDGMPRNGLRILNVGFGLGMIDTYFQEACPAEHVIIEPHRRALAEMKRLGWYDKPNVKILEGRWQAFLERESIEVYEDSEDEDEEAMIIDDRGAKASIYNYDPYDDYIGAYERTSNSSSPVTRYVRSARVDIGKFDIVYFDTFMEGYRGHYAFIKHVPRLLKGPGSRFSFFHGHGSKTESLSYIYSEVATMHHNDLGLNTEWTELSFDSEKQWFNLRQRKVAPQKHPHLIPICALAPTIPREIRYDFSWNPYVSRPRKRKIVNEDGYEKEYEEEDGDEDERADEGSERASVECESDQPLAAENIIPAEYDGELFSIS